MRGTGTSPRELRGAQELAVIASRYEAEADRLVMAIPNTWANHPEVAEANIRKQFVDDPERCRRSLEYLAELTEES
jgi:hypothetical protein